MARKPDDSTTEETTTETEPAEQPTEPPKVEADPATAAALARVAELEAEVARLNALLQVPYEGRPTKTKLVRIDGTHAFVRYGGGSLAFQPALHDPTDLRPHRIMSNDDAVVLQGIEPGKFAAETVVDTAPEAEPATAAA